MHMTHPGETFYPEGVRWDDPIARGTLPDLLSKAAAQFAARPAIEFRDRAISYPELEERVEVAASAFLRARYGKDTSVALFLGNSPDHPTNFFGALKAGARIVHLSPLDGAIALSHKLSDSGARVLVTSDLAHGRRTYPVTSCPGFGHDVPPPGPSQRLLTASPHHARRTLLTEVNAVCEVNIVR